MKSIAVALLPQPHSEFLARLRTIGVALGARGAVGVGLAGKQGGAAAPPWYTNWDHAWQGKSRSSKASSLGDLVGSISLITDTFDSTDPGWNTTNGWTFVSASKQAFDTQLTLPVDATVMIQFVRTGSQFLFGADGYASDFSHRARSMVYVWSYQTQIYNTSVLSGAGQYVLGSGDPTNVCFAGPRCYSNGVYIGSVGSPRTYVLAYQTMKLGAVGGNFWDRVMTGYFQGSVQAMAFKNTTPANTDAWVSARAAEMSSLPGIA